MPKPDFTGTWRFNREKSALQIQPPDRSTFVVDHREPVFCISRTHHVGDRQDTFSLGLTTNGTETVIDRGDVRLRSRAWWDGDALVFDTRIVQADGEASDLVRYTLSADRAAIVADERFRSSSLNYDNVWVLDRAQPEGQDGPRAAVQTATDLCAWCGSAVGEDAFMLRVGAKLCPSCAGDASRIAAEQRADKT